MSFKPKVADVTPDAKILERKVLFDAYHKLEMFRVQPRSSLVFVHSRTAICAVHFRDADFFECQFNEFLSEFHGS